MGASLVQLGRDGAELTPAGRLLVERGSGLATEFGNLIQAARTRAGTSGVRLRLLLPHGLAPQILALWYRVVRRDRPQMQLEVRFHRALNELDPEEFDVALQIAHRPPPGPWRCRVMLRVPTHLVASEGYLEEHGRPTSEAELRDHELALWVPTVGNEEVLPRVDGGTTAIQPGLVSANIAIVRWLALCGRAICFLPDPEVRDVALPTGPMHRVLEDRIRGEIAVWTVVPEILAEDPNVRWMLDRCLRVGLPDE